MTPETIELDRIVENSYVRSVRRGGVIDDETVKLYAQGIEEGDVFPPLDVFDIDGQLILAAGHHRLAAYRKAKKTRVRCNVYAGTIEDAWLHALRSNIQNGLSLTLDEKRAAAGAILEHPEHSKMSDRAIARHTGLSHVTIGKMRREAEGEPEAPDFLRMPAPEPPSGKFTTPDETVAPTQTALAEVEEADDEDDGHGIAFEVLQVQGWLTALRKVIGDELRLARAAVKTRPALVWFDSATTRNAWEKPLVDFLRLTEDCVPYAVCGLCGGEGCPQCLHRGWVNQKDHENRDADMRGEVVE